MAAERYFKVEKDYCQKCGSVREIVVEGVCYRKRRIVRPSRVIGFKCDNCGDLKYAN